MSRWGYFGEFGGLQGGGGGLLGDCVEARLVIEISLHLCSLPNLTGPPEGRKALQISKGV